MRDSQIAHVHVFVSDRPAAVEWLMTVWEAEPVAEDHEMSLFIFGSTQLVINDVADDLPSTVAFTSDNCDRDYRDVVARGAVSVDPTERVRLDPERTHTKGLAQSQVVLPRNRSERRSLVA
jgi:hypothetical protein